MKGRRAEAEGERWAREVGLDVSQKPDAWRITARIETHGELPKPVIPSLNTTYFWLAVTGDGWCVEMQHRRSTYICAKSDGKYGVLGGKLKVGDRPKSLRTIRAWLTNVEKKLGVTFRRDRPFIKSNIKGGARAMAAWIKE